MKDLCPTKRLFQDLKAENSAHNQGFNYVEVNENLEFWKFFVYMKMSPHWRPIESTL